MPHNLTEEEVMIVLVTLVHPMFISVEADKPPVSCDAIEGRAVAGSQELGTVVEVKKVLSFGKWLTPLVSPRRIRVPDNNIAGMEVEEE